MNVTGKILGCFLAFALLQPSVVLGFDFSKMVDKVGESVKSGVKAVEKGVDDLTSEVKKRSNKEQTQKSGTTTVQKQDGKTSNQAKKGTMAGKAVQPGSAEGLNGSRFSKSPIDPNNLSQAVTMFEAGDPIYGILKTKTSWKKATGESYILIYLHVDGKQKAYKSVNMMRADLYNSNYFIIDIAPEPDKMVNYTDQDINWPEKNGYKFGPELFTKIISELSPGSHRVKLEVKSYGKVHAAAEFTIKGDNYSSYAKRLADIRAGAGKNQKMPRAGMTDMAMQKKMINILKNKGWPKIERLVIVDKDWWIDRKSGGNSRIVSRHIEAAAAAKDSDGSYYFRHVTFHEQKLLTGGWAPLELTNTGKKKAIPKNNIHL